MFSQPSLTRPPIIPPATPAAIVTGQLIFKDLLKLNDVVEHILTLYHVKQNQLWLIH